MVPCAKFIVRTWAVKIRPRSVQGKNTGNVFATGQEPVHGTVLIGPDVGPTGSVRQRGRRGWPLVVFGHFCPYKSDKKRDVLMIVLMLYKRHLSARINLLMGANAPNPVHPLSRHKGCKSRKGQAPLNPCPGRAQSAKPGSIS